MAALESMVLNSQRDNAHGVCFGLGVMMYYRADGGIGDWTLAIKERIGSKHKKGSDEAAESMDGQVRREEW